MILSFDIGGSRIRAALWDGATLRTLGEVATPTHDLSQFTAAITGFAAGKDVQGLTISIAGVVDPETGIGKVANVPSIDGVALGPVVQVATGLRVLILNDADCFTLAEAKRGAGRGHQNVFGVILGTGVGGGLVMGGQVVTGTGGFAGEWGHGPVIRGKYAFRCGCGQIGCLDTIGGARGLERLHAKRVGEAVAAEVLMHRWQAGEATAERTLTLWRDLISGPLAMVLNVVGASIVPVGGGLSRAPGLVDYLDQAVRPQILRFTPGPLLVAAECGADAGILGAALAGQAAWG